MFQSLDANHLLFKTCTNIYLLKVDRQIEYYKTNNLLNLFIEN